MLLLHEGGGVLAKGCAYCMRSRTSGSAPDPHPVAPDPCAAHARHHLEDCGRPRPQQADYRGVKLIRKRPVLPTRAHQSVTTSSRTPSIPERWSWAIVEDAAKRSGSGASRSMPLVRPAAIPPFQMWACRMREILDRDIGLGTSSEIAVLGAVIRASADASRIRTARGGLKHQLRLSAADGCIRILGSRSDMVLV